MKRTILGIMFFLTTVSSAYASHYDLPDVDLLPAEIVTKLANDKIDTTEDLFALLMRKSDRVKFAKQYNIAQKDVDNLARKLELMQIVGIGPKAATLLLLSDTPNINALANATANALLDTLQRVSREKNVTGVQPDLTVVTDWINKAKQITNRIEE